MDIKITELSLSKSVRAASKKNWFWLQTNIKSIVETYAEYNLQIEHYLTHVTNYVDS